GQFQFSIDELVRECRGLKKSGVESIILFGIPDRKDAKGTGAWAKNGIVQQATRAVKDALPDLLVIADVCLCEYTDHGHCGVIKGKDVDNDATLPLLQKVAASQVEAGADVVAPSGMMDGVVGALREALPKTTILAYAAKYASAFYGPFRQAAESAPRSGDRATYQMDAANAEEALREIDLDIREGADIIMVKPALAYLDVVRRAKEKFGWPMAAYNVSGEYAMIKAAGERGWIDEKRIILEVLTSIKRAGADFILTYFARGAAEWIT
ncbi:MAG TPA: porphobilinogen synthase, partial [Planctomycetota bacterium]|nr:porphobilinogen synthase [Planctomycetota bacterium]